MLTPIIMIIFGVIFKNHPPKNINGFYGYKTSRSTQNADTWEFAHKLCGKIWYISGFIMLPISILLMLTVINKDKDTIGIAGGILCIVQCGVLLYSIILVEKALKNTFNEFGLRKHK